MAGGGQACAFGELRMGSTVRVSRLQDQGVVRYLGPIDGQEGDWVGVEMDRPQRALGKNDGTMGGVRLFQCEPRHGAFVRASAVLRLDGGVEEAPARRSVAAPGGLLPPEARAAAAPAAPAPAPAPKGGAAAAPQAAAPPAAAPPAAAAAGSPCTPAAPKAAGKGKGKGPPPPKGGGLAAAKAEKEKAAAATGEGANVEVLSGAHAGKRAVVVKVTGEGKEARYRVTIEGGGPTTWVDSVQPAAGGAAPVGGGAPSPAAPPAPSAPAPAKPAAPPAPLGAAGDAKTAAPKGKGKGKGPPPVPTKAAAAPPKPKKEPVAAEGAVVEVASGPHAGKRATVLKVTGEGKDTRWRVQVDGGPATWVDAVGKAA